MDWFGFVMSYGFTIIAGFLFSVVVHEDVHYLTARAFTDEISLERDGYDPNIQFHSPYELPKWGIKLSGGLPTLVGLMICFSIVVVANPIASPSHPSVFIFATGVMCAGGGFMSGGDWLAVLSPQEFQEFAEQSTHEAPSLTEAFSLIFG